MRLLASLLPLAVAAPLAAAAPIRAAPRRDPAPLAAVGAAIEWRRINLLHLTDVHSFIAGNRHEGVDADYGDLVSFVQHEACARWRMRAASVSSTTASTCSCSSSMISKAGPPGGSSSPGSGSPAAVGDRRPTAPGASGR